MIFNDLEKELMKLAQDARDKGYKVKTPTLSADSIYGSKLAYYQHGSNKIVIHDDFVQNASLEEIENTLIHELAHAVAEQNNTTSKRIWHGDSWKAINTELGGNAERYHKGGYKKPEHKKMSMAELYAIQPTKPATEWDRGTFKQWLSRGYHVMKGQHGQLSVWTFGDDEYELTEDGKTGNGGRASAIYFSPEQVEANKPKEATK
jgi:antirestriction protein ArdC